MVPTLEAILFDLDGTIINSEPLWLKAAMELLNRLHIKLSPSESAYIEKLIYGATIFDACAQIRHILKLTVPLEDMIKEAQGILIDLYQHDLHFVPGFLDFYDKVTKNSLKTALVTNSDIAVLDAVITLLKLDSFFGKNIFSVSDVSQGKPDPAVYLYALQKLNIAASHALAIEDSAVGIKAARTAGLLCIGIDNGHNSTHIIDADYMVKSFGEIALLLKL